MFLEMKFLQTELRIFAEYDIPHKGKNFSAKLQKITIIFCYIEYVTIWLISFKAVNPSFI